MIAAVLPILRSRWAHYAALGLLCMILWLRGNAWENAAGRWKDAHHAQEKALVATAAAAKAKAIAARIATENKTAELARRADNAEAQVDDLRAAADRFGTSRMRSSLCGPARSRSAPASEGSPAPDRDGPGADALVLTRSEYDELVSNSIRLERVRQWGQSLVTEGLAVPEVEFGR